MIASELILTKEEAIALRLTDAYSIHRIVYDLFEDVRTDEAKKKSIPSGILFADKGVRNGTHFITILSDRHPKNPPQGTLRTRLIPDSFLTHDRYMFEVTLNPTKREKNSGKIIAIRGRTELLKWFTEKALRDCGFRPNEETLRMEINTAQRFWKNDREQITQSSVMFIGDLQVIDKEKFSESFRRGIGRGRSFGFGLFLIVPILK